MAPAAFAACAASTTSSAVVGESAAKMPPEWNQRTPEAKMAFQSKSPGFRWAAASLAAVVEDDGGAHALAAVAIDSGHVRAEHAIVREVFIERRDAHGADALGDEIADGIIGHGGGDAGLEPEAIREISGDVELTAADVDEAFRRPCGRE